MTFTERMRHINRNRIAAAAIKTVLYVMLINFAFIFIFPFLYMVVNSLKSNTDLYDPTVNWIPKEIWVNNYRLANVILKYSRYVWYSIQITIIPTIGHLVSCSLIGYGFARYEFPGKRIIFFMVVVAMIVPVQTIIIPQYMLFSNLNWVNTLLPVFVPSFFGFGLKGALFIYLFMQYFKGLPKELEEAAYVDGCGFIKTFVRIVLPLAQSIFIVTIMLSMVWRWNDFYEPGIYLVRFDLAVLPARLQAISHMVNFPSEEMLAMMDDYSMINNGVLMAGTAMVIAPVIVAFGFLQRRFIQGIERAGLTGE